MIFSCISYAHAEFVFLKSGSIIEGRIVEDRARTVVILKKDGKRSEVKREDILRINYTQMYTGKYSIMKSSEEVFDAYVVDENQDSVTFRTEWENPKEIVINRDNILFMTRKNPTSLQCVVDNGRVKLSWTPPFMDVDFYNIYYKEDGGDYIKAGDTSLKHFTLPQLDNDKVYTIYITAVDDYGYESLPSKEIRIYSVFMKIRYELEYTDSGDTYSLFINWDRLNFKGSDIVKYDIYRKTKNGFINTGSTSGQEFTITGLKSDEDTLIEIRPVAGKDMLIEGNSVVLPRLFYNEQIAVSIHGAYLIPLGNLKDVTESGYGAIIELMIQNYFLKRLSLGLQTGYILFPGLKGDEYLKEDIEMYSMVPLLFGGRYGFSPLRSLYVSAGCFAGLSYSTIEYDKLFFESGNWVEKQVKKKGTNTLLSAGIQIQWQVWSNLLLHAGCDYNLIIEDKANYPFMSFYVGAGYGF